VNGVGEMDDKNTRITRCLLSCLNQEELRRAAASPRMQLCTTSWGLVVAFEEEEEEEEVDTEGGEGEGSDRNNAEKE
jgi:hypothetical protein